VNGKQDAEGTDRAAGPGRSLVEQTSRRCAALSALEAAASVDLPCNQTRVQLAGRISKRF